MSFSVCILIIKDNCLLCSARAGVNNRDEFLEALRDAHEATKSLVVIALDDVHKGYGKKTTIADMGSLLALIRGSADAHMLVSSSESNVINEIANDGGVSPFLQGYSRLVASRVRLRRVSVLGTPDSRVKEYLRNELQLKDEKAVGNWVSHFNDCLSALEMVYGRIGLVCFCLFYY